MVGNPPVLSYVDFKKAPQSHQVYWSLHKKL